MAFPVGTLRHEKLRDIHTPHWLSELEAAICSENEADSKVTTHQNDASAHHAKTTGASEITSGRFTMARMPDIGLNKVMVGQGPGNSPTEEDKPALAGLAIYGDGSDGDVTVSENTNLSRDMFYNNLTIAAGVTLKTTGYRVFVKGTLTNNGTTANDGSSATGNSGAYGSSSGTLGGGGKGGNASPSYDESNKGENVRGLGGNGGDGGGGGTYSQGGTVAACRSGGRAIPAAISLFETDETPSKIEGGAGGGCGNTSIQCGGGGGGGGLVLVCAKSIDNSSGTIRANGGGGGSQGDFGGGGGGGGTVIIVFNSATWGIEEALGGTGGTGSSINGADGSPGKVIKVSHT